MSEWTNTCPACGAQESLDALFQRIVDDDEARRAIHDVVRLSLPLGAALIRYVRLHKPPKQRLRMSRLRELLAELVRDMQRSSIERHGRVWMVSREDWRGAFEAVFAAVEKGSLLLPLQGNGYLYQVLTRQADQAEAGREAQREQAQHGRRDTVLVRGQPLEIGEALQVAYAGKDPALAKLDEDARRAAPIPAGVRAQLDQLKKGRL